MCKNINWLFIILELLKPVDVMFINYKEIKIMSSKQLCIDKNKSIIFFDFTLENQSIIFIHIEMQDRCPEYVRKKHRSG